MPDRILSFICDIANDTNRKWHEHKFSSRNHIQIEISQKTRSCVGRFMMRIRLVWGNQQKIKKEPIAKTIKLLWIDDVADVVVRACALVHVRRFEEG